MTSSLFERETLVEKTVDGRWQGHLSHHWNIGENPNGGYMLSCALSAIRQSVAHPDPLSITTHFLRPGTPDAPFEIVVETLREGRSVATVRATMSQQGKSRLEVLCAFGNLSQSVGVDETLELKPQHDMPAAEQCPSRSGENQGVLLPLMDRLDIRINPTHAEPGSSEHAQMSGWIRLLDDHPPTSLILPMFADAFPPSPFTKLGVVGWVPTLELTVHVRRRPQPGWIRAEFHTSDLTGGRMIETGALWDSSGRLVAQSRQLGLVLSASD